MLYHHSSEVKGCNFGLKTLYILKERYPQLKAFFFGVPVRPNNLPSWIEYYRCPDKETHNAIYNQAAIYIAPSLQEGFGLPLGEAMMCGAVVVCTDIGGFSELARNNDTALVSPVKDPVAMANNVSELIEDDNLRYKIADNGYRHIQNYTWEKAYNKLKGYITDPAIVIKTNRNNTKS
jgi:glycosyltransferase involved in cell wall biosynthesis